VLLLDYTSQELRRQPCSEHILLTYTGLYIHVYSVSATELLCTCKIGFKKGIIQKLGKILGAELNGQY
jgi:hypothetical protein